MLVELDDEEPVGDSEHGPQPAVVVRHDDDPPRHAPMKLSGGGEGLLTVLSAALALELGEETTPRPGFRSVYARYR
jgi:hypothetical protein